MAQFAGWCRADPSSAVVRSLPACNLGDVKLADIRGRKFAKVVDGNESLLGCFIPSGSVFPSMLDELKQGEAPGKNMVARRIQPHGEKRFNDTVRSLRDGVRTFWLGHSGVSKSTEANFVLMEFLEHLGEDGWPKSIIHRVFNKMYLYKTDSDGNVIVESEPALSVAAVEEYCGQFDYLPRNQRPLLFLELKEEELIPTLNVPIFVAVSSRDAESQLKPYMKGDSYRIHIVPPHSEGEIRLLGKLMLHADRSGTLSKLGLASDSTEKDCMAAIDKRMEAVGPLSRQVFLSDPAHKDYVEAMKSNVDQFFGTLAKDGLSYSNIPAGLKFYLAPYPTDADQTDVTYRFLSVYAANLVRAAAKLPEQVEVLLRYGLYHQIHEAVLMSHLMELPADEKLPEWAISGWEWYEDPGFSRALSGTQQIESNTIVHPKCASLREFEGQVFPNDAKSLEPQVLYKSKTHNFKLGEYFTYDNASKSINFYACSTTPLQDHDYSVASIRQVIASFGLNDEGNRDVKLNLISFVDWSKRQVHGCKFKLKPATPTEFNNKTELTITDLQKSTSSEDIGQRFNSYIVRAGFYDMAKFE